MTRKQASTYNEPLDVLLGTTVRVRILRSLDEANDVRRASDLARLTDVDPTALQRAMKPLVESGLIERIGSGRGAVYRLKSAHPFAPALREIFSVERARRHAIPDAARNWAEASDPQPVAVWLFGSVARQEDGFGSDVDLALITPGSRSFPFQAQEQALVAAREHGDLQAEALRDALRPIAERMALSPNVIVLLASEILALQHEQASLWKGLLEDSETLFGPSAQALVRRLEREGAIEQPTPVHPSPK